MRRTVYFALAMVALVSLVLAGAGCGAAGGSFPNKPFELVVQAAAAGGSDIIARTAADILQKEKIISQSIAVVNKAEGGGTEAYIYLKGKKGDPYYMATGTVSFLTNPLRGMAPYTYKDFTPLANVASDTFVVLVGNDSKFQTFQEVIDASKKAPKSVSVGGSRVGSDDHILSYLITEATGAQFNYIAFQSGGQVMTNLLGGQIDMASANPGEALAQIEGKKARPLAVSFTKRLDSLPDVPTLQELGIDIVWTQFRGFVAPPDIPQEAKTYLENALEKMAQTQAWKDYLKKNDQMSDIMKGDAFYKYLEAQNAKYDKVMTALNLKK